MDKIIGQPKRVLDILRKYPLNGITSQELRIITRIVDIPKTISLLREKGVKIESKSEHLGDSIIKRYWLKEEKKEPIYSFEGNKAKIIGYK